MIYFLLKVGLNRVVLIISDISTIIIGVGIIGLWTILLRMHQVLEIETEPIRIKFHIVAEFSIGILSFISGIILLFNIPEPPIFLS